MRKRLTALGLIMVLLLSLASCAAEPKEKDPIQEFIENKTGQDSAFVAFDKEEEEMKDPLVICMDLEYVGREPYDTSVVLNEFLNTLEQSGGLSDVVIEYIPKHGADREGMLDRIRVELMTGGGPDVFIVNCGGTTLIGQEQIQPLFPFPEKVMESGLFLPLDTYMENNTQFTEWDKQTQAVLAAGRNEEGQQIIPLTYTLPLLCYSQADVEDFPVAENATWMDIVNDPEHSELARPMYDCFEMLLSDGEYIPTVTCGHVEMIFGDLADFKEEELLLTEEEILQRVKEIFTLWDRTSETAPEGVEKYPYALTWFGSQLQANGSMLVKETFRDEPVELFSSSEPLTMIPIYSDDGGVTASIMSFAAVNRNTQRPEEAYTVIDLLMRDFVQRKYMLYSELLTGIGVGISMHEDLMQEETTVGGRGQWHMVDQRYQEVCKIRDQITAANFQSELDRKIYDMLLDCYIVKKVEGGTEEDMKEIIAEYHEIMQRMVRE